MDELAKSIQEKYIDDLTSKYPLHKFLMLLMIIFFMLNYHVGNLNIYNILSKTSIKEILDFQNGILSELTIIQFLLALMMVHFFSKVYRKVNVFSFVKLTNRYDFKGYTAKIIKKYESIKRNDSYDLFIVKEINKKIEIKNIELRTKTLTSEIFMSLLICILWAGDLSIANFLAIFSLSILFVFLQWQIYKFYIIQFFPLYVARNYLLNENISFENGYRNC